MDKEVQILFCGCAYSDVVPRETKAKVLGAIEQSGVSFHIVADLCRAAANERDMLKGLAENKRLKVVGCHERAMKWLFKWAGVDTENIEFYNMRTNSADNVILSLLGENKNARSEALISKDTDWIPWFPVIDEDLCVNCKQCLNFCLFSVYTLVDGKVTVTNPDSCKTNCPACAKVCPKSAIIFPKFDKSPINGDKVDPNAVKSVDMSALAEQQDLRQRLRARNRSRRFAPVAGEDQGLSKLKNLQHELDIPQDVIDSLSSEFPQSPLTDNKSRKDNDSDSKEA